MSYGGIFFLLLFCSSLAVLVHGQLQTGFVSIDCGAPENFNYVDIDTGISYTSDGAFIHTGVNRNISAEYAYPNNPTLPQPLSDLRSFPNGSKNCYALRPTRGRGSLNLIRASFLYGNYDGENKPPRFELYLDVVLWASIQFTNASNEVTKEVISVAASDTIHVCLVNIGLGTPFLSALELRPLNDSIYNAELRTSALLVLLNRLDAGSSNTTGRYRDDVFDRMWYRYNSPDWVPITSSLPVDTSGNGYKAPEEVIKTAVSPVTGSESLNVYWNAPGLDSQFYIYMHFAELERLERNQSRKFNISWNGSPLFNLFSPRYLYAASLSNSRALVGKNHHVSIHKAGNSTMPPILNAFEIYMVKQPVESLTYSEDAMAITRIRTVYNIGRDWMGDPCGPKNYTWKGLKCSYNSSSPPRIVSLNMASSGLSGELDSSIAKLSSLMSLDLSNNRLTGPVPAFLAELQSLVFLDLKSNNFSGSVHATLIERSNRGLLTLRVDDRNLHSSDSHKKKKIVVPLVASILPVLLLIILIIVWTIRRKKQPEAVISSNDGKSLALKKILLTYADIVRITNNFQTVIGKGGFGTVYLGCLKDGTQVAVKMLSLSSSQGSKAFKTEAELLMRVHHRNLTSLIGYCEEKTMVLVYEYMAYGNLQQSLSARSSHKLSWERRLQIAIDAAQGLEYLHYGCKPPIIHRDVKTANILLSENLEAKIADFGLSKLYPSDGLTHLSTTVMGTRGYLDPEYLICQRLTEKSDVYSFGVVLLELITGKPAIIRSTEKIHIVDWVSHLPEEGEVRRIVDQRLQGDFNQNSLQKALELAMSCTTPSSMQRVTMSYVLAELKECLAVELASGRKPGASEESYATSNYSSEFFTTNNDSMTSPSPR